MTHRGEILFKRSVQALLRSYGADPATGRGYDYGLATPAGELRVTVYEDWVACRFSDPATAITTLPDGAHRQNLNPYSGKWNWHYISGWTATEAIADFEQQLRELFACTGVLSGGR